MTNLSGGRPKTPRFFNWHGWKPIVVTVALSVVVVAVVLNWRELPAPVAPPSNEPTMISKRVPPAPREVNKRIIELASLKGTSVYRIQTSEQGDEIIVDRATGKLLAVRDYMGRTIWGQPMAGTPMTMSDPPVKGS